jgi:hypothetical protein
VAFRRIALAILTVSALATAMAGGASADIGPKPTMSFAFSFGRSGLTIADGQLLMCQDARCGDPEPLKTLGPQRFTCDAHTCAARAYGFARFAMLNIKLSDGRTLRSNVFSSPDFDAKFSVRVGPRALNVQPQR